MSVESTYLWEDIFDARSENIVTINIMSAKPMSGDATVNVVFRLKDVNAVDDVGDQLHVYSTNNYWNSRVMIMTWKPDS